MFLNKYRTCSAYQNSRLAWEGNRFQNVALLKQPVSPKNWFDEPQKFNRPHKLLTRLFFANESHSQIIVSISGPVSRTSCIVGLTIDNSHTFFISSSIIWFIFSVRNIPWHIRPILCCCNTPVFSITNPKSCITENQSFMGSLWGKLWFFKW